MQNPRHHATEEEEGSGETARGGTEGEANTHDVTVLGRREEVLLHLDSRP
jgi:hypothetical protein